MGTILRASIAESNPNYISKHRYYELKHYCLQYKEWRGLYLEICSKIGPIKGLTDEYDDPTGELATMKTYYEEQMRMVNDAANETDEVLGSFIFKAVTEDRTYTYLSTVLGIPCGKNTYYSYYRKFFYILSNKLMRR